MKRYKINYDAIASGVATIEEVFGGRQADRLVEEIAGKLVGYVSDFRSWMTAQFQPYDNLAWEISASFSDEGGFEVDYIEIGASNAEEMVSAWCTKVSDTCWKVIEWNSFFLSDEECKAVEECANELYALNNK